jgi:hypothetical protein
MNKYLCLNCILISIQEIHDIKTWGSGCKTTHIFCWYFITYNLFFWGYIMVCQLHWCFDAQSQARTQDLSTVISLIGHLLLSLITFLHSSWSSFKMHGIDCVCVCTCARAHTHQIDTQFRMLWIDLYACHFCLLSVKLSTMIWYHTCMHFGHIFIVP